MRQWWCGIAHVRRECARRVWGLERAPAAAGSCAEQAEASPSRVAPLFRPTFDLHIGERVRCRPTSHSAAEKRKRRKTFSWFSGSSPASGTINTETEKKVPEHTHTDTGGDAKEQQQRTGEPRREIALPWRSSAVELEVRERGGRPEPGGTNDALREDFAFGLAGRGGACWRGVFAVRRRARFSLSV